MFISGVQINFPFEPYRAQNAVMYAIVKSIQNSDNCILESPTGTGKTIAALCSALATQKHLNKETDLLKVAGKSCDEQSEHAGEINHAEYENSKHSLNSSIENKLLSTDDCDFQPMKKFRSVKWQNSKVLLSKDQPSPPSYFEYAFKHTSLDAYDNNADADRSIFRIFYVSRTHNQLKQVANELKKISHPPKMTILAARDEYCINSNLEKDSNLSQNCLQLVHTKSCVYHSGSHRIVDTMQNNNSPWDIEDLLELGTQCTACPYYASEELYKQAELVLCPYNYVLDPVIRKSKGINIKNDVVLFDEAHNVESCARDVVSFSLNAESLRNNVHLVQTVKEDMQQRSLALAEALESIKNLQYCLLNLLEESTNHSSFQFNGIKEEAIFEGEELLSLLSNSGIATCKLKYWSLAHDIVFSYGGTKEREKLTQLLASKPILKDFDLSEADEETANKNEELKKLDNENVSKHTQNGRMNSGTQKDDLPERDKLLTSLNLTERVVTTLQYFFRNCNDYMFYVTREIDQFHAVTKFGFRCLSAGVSMRDLSNMTRSVLVISGTLSPMEPFGNELGIWFATMKSVPHIVDTTKSLIVAVEAISSNGTYLTGTFREASKFSYQDSIGKSILDYCKIIPQGVIIFFPSYAFMNTLIHRWKSTNLFHSLEEMKECITVESPAQRKDDIDSSQILKNYRHSCNTEKGAVLLAVCRGRFSEGINFKNEMSRGILMIGIPFPNIKDGFIKSKMTWNDRTYNILNDDHYSGKAWYETQAFRAVNQAIGRSIRNREDYCSVVLLDSRYTEQFALSRLSTWIRRALLRNTHSHSEILETISFFHNRFK